MTTNTETTTSAIYVRPWELRKGDRMVGTTAVVNGPGYYVGTTGMAPGRDGMRYRVPVTYDDGRTAAIPYTGTSTVHVLRETAAPLTFAGAMATACPSCGRKAALHRLTASGRLYCAVPAKPAPPARGFSRIYTGGAPDYYAAVHVYTCPVRELPVSPLPVSIGKAIRAGLTSYVDTVR